jgi:hypothetical protein
VRASLKASGPTFVCATWENAIIYLFNGQITKDILLQIDAVHDELATRFPGRTVAVSISAANLPLPDAEARALSTQLIKKRPPDAVVSAIVLEGNGFWAASARAVITTMFLVAGTARKNKVFATIKDAAEWAAPFSDHAPTTKEGLLEATLEVRGLLGKAG